PAIIKAIETTDTQLKRVIDAIEAAGGVAFVTADHGNAELNIDPKTGERHTAHTINPVPAILTNQAVSFITPGANGVSGGLSDIAPTMLALLGVQQPEAMTGKVLSR
ncbi:MAG: 2,3-bisphosphoglycerate-independent phosphoglycerate mutase, partial [Candidatus Paceibacterota bacterium]